MGVGSMIRDAYLKGKLPKSGGGGFQPTKYTDKLFLEEIREGLGRDPSQEDIAAVDQLLKSGGDVGPRSAFNVARSYGQKSDRLFAGIRAEAEKIAVATGAQLDPNKLHALALRIYGLIQKDVLSKDVESLLSDNLPIIQNAVLADWTTEQAGGGGIPGTPGGPGTPGPVPPTGTPEQKNSAASAIKDVLGRDASPEEIEHFANELASGGLKDIYELKEFLN